jgi:hypothetical protein
MWFEFVVYGAIAVLWIAAVAKLINAAKGWPLRY